MLLQPESHGLWAATAPVPPATLPLLETVEIDIAIVGAGFTGMSTALHLAEAGVEVAVVEANEIGFGGSGRNAGLVNPGFWLPLPQMVGTLGQKAAERMIKDLGNAPTVVFDLIKKHGIECEAVRNGNLHMAHSAAGLKELIERCEEWGKRGAPVEMLNKEEAAAKTGTRVYHGAMLDHRSGTIQPLSYVRGLAHAATKAGARLFTQSPVTSITHDGKRWTVKSQDGVIHSNRLLIATGGYGEKAKQTRHSTVACFYFQCATKPLSHNILSELLPDKNGTWDTHPILKSFRLDAEGRLIFGSIGRLNNGGGLHKVWANRKMHTMFPQVPEESWGEAWYGRIAMTSDHMPRLKEIGPEGLAIYGYNGRGIGPGTVFGRAIAEYFKTGNRNALPFPLTPKASEPFAKVRGSVIEMGARAFHIFDGWL